MKTSVILFIAALFLMAIPAFAEKYKPVPMVGCGQKKSNGSLSHRAKRYNSDFSSGKSGHRFGKKNKGFEKPKNKLSKLRKNPNHTKNVFRDGGFFSFRRGTY